MTTADRNAVLDIEPTRATHVLVMACSATKRADEGDLPAIDRYDGPMWRTLRARLAELPRARKALASGKLAIVVLSAQFGFIPADLAIPNYERVMTKARADELCSSAMGDPTYLRTRFEEAGAVMFAGGELYRSAMWRASRASAAERVKVTETDGGGIGIHRAELGAWLEEHFGSAKVVETAEARASRIIAADCARGECDAAELAPYADPEVEAVRQRLAERVDVEVETHRRVTIYRNSEHGFHASASCAIHFGYCDTVEEVRDEIDDYLAEEAEHYRGVDTPEDTPSLDTSFHDHEAAGAMNAADMTLEERSYFGLEPGAHVVAYRERERLARIKRDCERFALRHATGIRFRGGVVSFA